MHSYGALKMGRLRFFHPGSTSSAGNADFVHLWHFLPNPDGRGCCACKLARGLSNDHNAAQP